MTTPMAINNIDISANEVADGTQSSVGVRAKDAIIQKEPNGIETLENIRPVMETLVIRNKTSPFDFLILHT